MWKYSLRQKCEIIATEIRAVEEGKRSRINIAALQRHIEEKTGWKPTRKLIEDVRAYISAGLKDIVYGNDN